MLDTDISSYIIKRRPPSFVQRFEAHAEELCVSVMTAAELRFGAEGGAARARGARGGLPRAPLDPRLVGGGHAALRASQDRLGALGHADREHGAADRISRD